MTNNRKVVLASAAVGAVILGLMIYSSIGLGSFRVEVCMGFQGRESCRTASGEDREKALRAAITNACAMISSGMTDSRSCEISNPLRVRWLSER